MVKVPLITALIIGLSSSVLAKDVSTELSSPDGEGPFPTLIISHGSGGKSNFYYDWINKFNEWGYATVLLDHFTNRGRRFRWHENADIREKDVDPVLDEVLNNPKLDNDKLSLLGWSAGEVFVRKFAEKHKIKSAVLFYPSGFACHDGEVSFTAPILVMHGSEDLTLGCWERLSYNAYQGYKKHVIYPNTYHGFDIPFFTTLRYKGRRGNLGFLYDAKVHEQSIQETKNFLTEYAK